MYSLVIWAWGSVPRIFHKLKQIERATSARSCSVPHWCRQKAWCFLQGWSSGEGIGMRIIQGYGSWAREQTSGTSSRSPLLCPVDWRRCPLKASGLSGCPWIAARGLQLYWSWNTGKMLRVLSGFAENKDGCWDIPIFPITSFKSVILFMELKLQSLLICVHRREFGVTVTWVTYDLAVRMTQYEIIHQGYRCSCKR